MKITKDFNNAVYSFEEWNKIKDGINWGDDYNCNYILGGDVPPGLVKSKLLPECGYIFRESATNPGTYQPARVTMHPATVANYQRGCYRYSPISELYD